jgi:YaiO family outer membrane protein
MKTNLIKNRAFLLLILFGQLVFAQSRQEVPDPDASFERARELAFKGEHEAARDTLMKILQAYPEYTDVHTFLANTYRWDGNHGQARKHFNRITSTERNYEDAWLLSIKNELEAGNRSIALGLANKALQYLGESQAIRNIRSQILGTPVDAMAAEDPEEDREYKNRVSVANRLETFDQYYDPMWYTSVEYRRETSLGRVSPRINYSNRFGINGIQYELDLYPRLSNTFYAYLNYGYSDSELYPNHQGAFELFANLPRAKEASLGARYLQFFNSEATLLTGSFGIYRGNYYLSARPYLTVVQGRSPAASGAILARKYLSDDFHFLGIRASYGYSPELRQLSSGGVLIEESLLFLESQQLLFEYQFTSGNRQHLYLAQLGVSRQEYVLQPGAFFWVFGGGLTYRLRI